MNQSYLTVSNTMLIKSKLKIPYKLQIKKIKKNDEIN